MVVAVAFRLRPPVFRGLRPVVVAVAFRLRPLVFRGLRPVVAVAAFRLRREECPVLPSTMPPVCPPEAPARPVLRWPTRPVACPAPVAATRVLPSRRLRPVCRVAVVPAPGRALAAQPVLRWPTRLVPCLPVAATRVRRSPMPADWFRPCTGRCARRPAGGRLRSGACTAGGRSSCCGPRRRCDSSWPARCGARPARRWRWRLPGRPRPPVCPVVDPAVAVATSRAAPPAGVPGGPGGGGGGTPGTPPAAVPGGLVPETVVTPPVPPAAVPGGELPGGGGTPPVPPAAVPGGEVPVNVVTPPAEVPGGTWLGRARPPSTRRGFRRPRCPAT